MLSVFLFRFILCLCFAPFPTFSLLNVKIFALNSVTVSLSVVCLMYIFRAYIYSDAL